VRRSNAPHLPGEAVLSGSSVSAGKAAHRELENVEGQPATRHSEHAPPVSTASPGFSRSPHRGPTLRG
jgi:hypothetical protein